MSKYDSLSQYLAAQESKVTLTFDAIERILGFTLPRSARRHPAWWSNGSQSHVQAAAWLNAGFETAEVDLAGERISFLPRRQPDGLAESADPPAPSDPPPGTLGLRGGHPAWGAMKGTFKVPPDTDLTEPAVRHWADIFTPKEPAKRDER
jgi:hypothetical protein